MEYYVNPKAKTINKQIKIHGIKSIDEKRTYSCYSERITEYKIAYVIVSSFHTNTKWIPAFLSLSWAVL